MSAAGGGYSEKPSWNAEEGGNLAGDEGDVGNSVSSDIAGTWSEALLSAVCVSLQGYLHENSTSSEDGGGRHGVEADDRSLRRLHLDAQQVSAPLYVLYGKCSSMSTVALSSQMVVSGPVTQMLVAETLLLLQRTRKCVHVLRACKYACMAPAKTSKMSG